VSSAVGDETRRSRMVLLQEPWCFGSSRRTRRNRSDYRAVIVAVVNGQRKGLPTSRDRQHRESVDMLHSRNVTRSP
jgi:hypothetical protein